MKKVIFIAPVLTQSGYGVHSRQVLQYLFNLLDNGANFDLDIWPIRCGNTQFLLDKSDPFIRRIYKHTKRKHLEYDVSIQIQMPSPKEWNPSIAKVNIGITAGVETNICNPEWLNTINSMTQVIVPSEYTKQTFLNTAERFKVQLKNNISVIKEFVSETYYKTETLYDPLKDIDTKFNILVFGQITGLDRETDRKNLFLSLQTLYAGFHNMDDVGIIVKTNMGRETPLDRVQVQSVLAQIKEAVCDFTGGQGRQPKLYCLHGMMNEEELLSVYRSTKLKALYTTTRGEAVGLPIVEAAAAGLPIIAPSIGGHREYLAQKKWLPLKSNWSKIPAKKVDKEVFIEDASWIEVDPREAVNTLNRFYSNNEKPKDWAEEQAKQLKNKLSKQNIFKDYDKILKNYLI